MEWLTVIFGLLGPMLLKCQQSTSSQDPQEYLAAHYDPLTDTFSGSIVQDALPQTYRAIRKARRQASHEDRKNFPRYSREEVVEMTKQKLKASMTASKAEVEAAHVAAASLPDED